MDDEIQEMMNGNLNGGGENGNGRPKRIIKQIDRYSNFLVNKNLAETDDDDHDNSMDNDIELTDSDSDWGESSDNDDNYSDKKSNNKSNKNKNNNNKKKNNNNNDNITTDDEIDHVSETDLEATPTKKKKKLSLSTSKKIKTTITPNKSKSKSTTTTTKSNNNNNNNNNGNVKFFQKTTNNQQSLVHPKNDTSSWTSKPLKSEGSFSGSLSGAGGDRNFSPFNKTGPTFATSSKARFANLKSSVATGGNQSSGDFFQQFLYKPKPKEIDLLDDDLPPLSKSNISIGDSNLTTNSTSQPTSASTSPVSSTSKGLKKINIDDNNNNHNHSNGNGKDNTSDIVDIEDNENDDISGFKLQLDKDKNKKNKREQVEDDEEEEDDEPPIVNMKRIHRQSRPLFPTLPTTPTKRESHLAHQVVTVDLNEILNADDDESTEDELPSLIKLRTSGASGSINIDEDDESTQDEKEVKKEEEEEGEEEENEVESLMKGYDVDEDSDEETSQLDKLIKACELFSKRMLEILSSFQENKEENNNTSTAATAITAPSSSTTNRKLITQPSIIKRTMRSYQLIGLNWMGILYQEKISGILADEMGLGKTVQSISLLAHIYEKYKDTGPHLIIVPATTYSNWKRELEMWCPTLKVYSYYGTAKEREMMRYELRSMKAGVDFNIIITTYNILFSQIDRGFLKRYNYTYQLLDEAQNIKNSDSKRYKNLFKITVTINIPDNLSLLNLIRLMFINIHNST
ncbi:SNF2-related domain-containing protein [Heterostelium album PN500]|uniref:SNF2-related domain-containing protein n=1 Tax=Heterostelium pallidum (strain ATCC 26659 / Pp 5 / PN500) TaxID=670386 RepID=D3B6J2_HETP5|nr:SNF2-related domain-containing protein [Heterostelium album PN500]EFA82962.1 SNF2-related domain-containing protein [Heterostelium album PN500]|eukprot:XP_020435079.1 SNF2-related domain-containing protein [Heterostelium album PN500]